jgi:transposase-like protein
MTGIVRARYTLELKQEAIRLVEGGQTVSLAAETVGLSDQTLHNWLKAGQRVDWGLVLRDLDSSAAGCSPVIAASSVAMSSKRASAPASPPHSIGIALATMEPARIGFGVDKARRKRQSQHP